MREKVLAALAGGDWHKPSDIMTAVGASKGQALSMLRRLGEEGAAEWNGERTKSSRWRLAPTRKPRAKPEPEAPRRRRAAPVVDEDDDESGPLSE